MTRAFSVTFHLGLLFAGLIVVTGRREFVAYLLPLGVLQVGLLYLVGRRIPPPREGFVEESLLKAGFLHTLCGLAGAVNLIAVGNQTGAASAGSAMLAPIGASLVPHLLGVWFSHAIREKNFRPDMDLTTLQRQYAELVDENVKLMGQIKKNLQEVRDSSEVFKNSCSAAAETVSANVRVLNEAVKPLGDDIRSIGRETQNIRNVHSQLIKLLESSLFNADSDRIM
jgi:hypothetical protein